MKTTTPHSKTSKLDIRFISTDSQNPHVLSATFSREQADKISRELHQKLGHLCDDIKKTAGHINVYTLGNSVIGQPQFVNFSKDVWDKIQYPHEIIRVPDLQSLSTEDEDDYIDHENYNDV